MKIGDIVWTILPNIEAEVYGDEKPRPPWKVCVNAICGRDYFRASAISEEGILDLDSNSSVMCDGSNFFPTREAALEKWRERLGVYADNLEAEANQIRDELSRFSEIPRVNS